MSVGSVQITNLEPSTPSSPSYYIVQIRGLDALGNPGPWSEWITFQTAYQIDPDMTDIVPGNPIGGELPIYDGTTWRYGFIQPNSLADEAITETKIANNAISTPKLQANSITADKMSANSIEAVHIQANVIKGYHIEASSITTDKIAAGAVGSINIAGSLQSDNWNASLSTGWRIDRNTGRATFNDVEVRGTVFATNGSFTGRIVATDGIISGNLIVAGTITNAQIAQNTIDWTRILQNTIRSFNVQLRGLDNLRLALGTLTPDEVNYMDASDLTTGTITSRTFQTKATGARVLIAGLDNKIKFFNSSSMVGTIGMYTSNSYATPDDLEVSSSKNNLVLRGKNAINITGRGMSSFITGDIGFYTGFSSSTAYKFEVRGSRIIMPGVNAFRLTSSSRYVRISSGLFSPSLGTLGVVVSSIKHKKDVESLNPTEYNNILKLNPVKFKWKSDDSEDYGLIAEEVEEVMPELVFYEYPEDTDINNISGAEKELVGVEYERIPIYQIAILKDHENMIQSLNARISELEERLLDDGR